MTIGSLQSPDPSLPSLSSERTRALSWIDDLLRGRSSESSTIVQLVALTILSALIYGGAMGSYGGLDDGRAWQVVFAAIKLPILLASVLALCLPSFLVLNMLFGLTEDLGNALRAVARAQVIWLILLVALTPYTLMGYAVGSGYETAILMNTLMFALASLGAQLALRRAYRPLIARNSIHRWLLWAWLILFALVGIQVAWMLRPFIGATNQEVQFVRDDFLSNAYERVAQILWNGLRKVVRW